MSHSLEEEYGSTSKAAKVEEEEEEEVEWRAGADVRITAARWSQFIGNRVERKTGH